MNKREMVFFEKRIFPLKGRQDKWTIEEKYGILNRYMQGRSLIDIASYAHRQGQSILTLIWKIFTNYQNEGTKLVDYIQSKDWDKRPQWRILEHTKWTERQSETLCWRRKNKDQTRFAALTDDQLAVLHRRSPEALRKQILTMFRVKVRGICPEELQTIS